MALTTSSASLSRRSASGCAHAAEFTNTYAPRADRCESVPISTEAPERLRRSAEALLGSRSVKYTATPSRVEGSALASCKMPPHRLPGGGTGEARAGRGVGHGHKHTRGVCVGGDEAHGIALHAQAGAAVALLVVAELRACSNSNVYKFRDMSWSSFCGGSQPLRIPWRLTKTSPARYSSESRTYPSFHVGVTVVVVSAGTSW